MDEVKNNFDFLKERSLLLCPNEQLVTKERVEFWKGEGFSFLPWGVHSKKRAKELKALGALGVTVDEIEEAKV